MEETINQTQPSQVGKPDANTKEQDLYGPWMQVSNCHNKKQPSATRNGGYPTNQPTDVSSSQRFNAFAVPNLEESLQEPTTHLPSLLQEANGYSKAKKGKGNQSLSLKAKISPHSMLSTSRSVDYSKIVSMSIPTTTKTKEISKGKSQTNIGRYPMQNSRVNLLTSGSSPLHSSCSTPPIRGTPTNAHASSYLKPSRSGLNVIKYQAVVHADPCSKPRPQVVH